MAGKVLVADATAAQQATAGRAGRSGLEVRVCASGREALALADSFRPDVLVVDMHLPELDGLSVAKALGQKPRRPAILMTTALFNEYIEQLLIAAGVDYAMVKPLCHEALNDRILDLLEKQGIGLSPEPAEQNDHTALLTALSLGAGRRGFLYLERALELYRADPQISMTKELYPQIGREFKASAKSVERAIRTVIEDGWKIGELGMWCQVFGGPHKPSNQVFLAGVCRYLRRQNVQRR